MRERNLDYAQILLQWYDKNARELPWRVSPENLKKGVVPDPYSVWLSEIMLQQTTVVTVRDYYQKFLQLWPTVFQLAKADDDVVMAAWAGLGYYARARNMLKCARIVANELEGKFPETEKELQKLPGIGPYTSAAITSIAFNKAAVVLDGNVERVMSRFHLVKEPLPKSKETLRAHAAKMLPKNRFGDYSQAVMDLGAVICKPKKTRCDICPWSKNCQAFDLGLVNELPKKVPKPKKPTRFGTCFVVRRTDGAVLLEKRDAKGLLGGMLGWPSTKWSVDKQPTQPLFKENWDRMPTKVRHTFTHFHLVLEVQTTIVPNSFQPKIGFFVHSDEFDEHSLPKVMRKVWHVI